MNTVIIYACILDALLRGFCQVRVVARIRQVASISSMWKRADGAGVSFVTVSII